MVARKSFRRYIPMAAGGLIVVCVLIGLLWVISAVLSKKDTGPKRQTLQIVKIIRPPPDLPPPPPPPPPDKVEQPIPKDKPDEKPDEAPPEQPLGLDADASAGSDGFGLAARKGGQDLLNNGAGAFRRYTNLLKSAVLDTLSDDERLRRGKYTAILRVWLASDGSVQRYALAQSSGSKELDGYIQQDISRVRMGEAPPIEMPQPITFSVGPRI